MQEYDRIETIVYGWSIVGLGLILAFLISKKPWKNKKIEGYEKEEL